MAPRWGAVDDGFNLPLLDASAISETDAVLDAGRGVGRTIRLAALRAARGRALGLDPPGPRPGKARESVAREGVENDAADASAFMLESGPGRHLLDQVTPSKRGAACQALTATPHRHEAAGGVWPRSSSWLVTAVNGGSAHG
ncbi:hypothetical protein [Streptomyces sp. NPDC058157]|uniref:hypothetical protein n=1 Tax=Streptomyces sp. NPDC058157 TaxID=3346360 RepID=UPI0036EDE7E7